MGSSQSNPINNDSNCTEAEIKQILYENQLTEKTYTRFYKTNRFQEVLWLLLITFTGIFGQLIFRLYYPETALYQWWWLIIIYFWVPILSFVPALFICTKVFWIDSLYEYYINFVNQKCFNFGIFNISSNNIFIQIIKILVIVIFSILYGKYYIPDFTILKDINTVLDTDNSIECVNNEGEQLNFSNSESNNINTNNSCVLNEDSDDDSDEENTDEESSDEEITDEESSDEESEDDD